MRQSSSYSASTPWELQREDAGGAHTVVAYYSDKPLEASLQGYRAIKREADPKAKPRGRGSRRAGGA